MGQAFANSSPRSLIPDNISATKKKSGRKSLDKQSTISLIQVDELEPVDFDTIGLQRNANGFNDDMWEGSDKDLVLKLLPKLPISVRSFAMRKLMYNLLVTSATSPKGSDAQQNKLLPLRIKLLVAMGEHKAVLDLLKLIPSYAVSEKQVQIQMNSLLLSGNEASACSEASEYVRVYDDSYWQKLRIFCYLNEEDKEKAAFGVTLLHEQNDKDKKFLNLADLILGQKTLSPASLSRPSALHISMLHKTGKRYPADVTSSRIPWISSSIALSNTDDIDAKLIAAEKAESMGALDTSILKKLYESVPFSIEEKEKPLSWAKENRDHKGRALLFQTTNSREELSVKAEIISRALKYAKEDNVFAAQARVYAEQIMQMPVSGEVVWFSKWAIKALLNTGEYNKAIEWYKLAQRYSGLNAEARIAVATQWAMLRISEPEGRVFLTSDSFDDFRKIFMKSKISKSRIDTVIANYLNIFSALGTKVRYQDWLKTSDTPIRYKTEVPSANIWNMLKLASEEGREAETALLSLITLGNDFPHNVAPLVAHQALESLRLAGFDKEARALAIELILAKQL